MAQRLTMRGLAASETAVGIEGGSVTLELVSERTVTVEFTMSAAAATGLATNLSQAGQTLLQATEAGAHDPGAAGQETVFAPLVVIEDAGAVVGQPHNAFLALRTEDGLVHRYRIAASDLAEFARDALLHLTGSADSEGGPH